jgi:hypothetical protein
MTFFQLVPEIDQEEAKEKAKFLFNLPVRFRITSKTTTEEINEYYETLEAKLKELFVNHESILERASGLEIAIGENKAVGEENLEINERVLKLHTDLFEKIFKMIQSTDDIEEFKKSPNRPKYSFAKVDIFYSEEGGRKIIEKVRFEGRDILSLRRVDKEILMELVRKQGRICTKAKIVNIAEECGSRSRDIDRLAHDSISRIKRKLEGLNIENRHGDGYLLTA